MVPSFCMHSASTLLARNELALLHLVVCAPDAVGKVDLLGCIDNLGRLHLLAGSRLV